MVLITAAYASIEAAVIGATIATAERSIVFGALDILAKRGLTKISMSQLREALVAYGASSKWIGQWMGKIAEIIF